jgi:hypothetical protein
MNDPHTRDLFDRSRSGNRRYADHDPGGSLRLPTRSPSARQPVLGSAHAFSGGKGFGTVKPKTVYFGGDPTGNFTNLTWTRWGTAKSTGNGKGYYPPPGKPVADAVRVPVTLVASKLGTCHGHLAYRRLAVTFIYKHHKEKGVTRNICS